MDDLKQARDAIRVPGNLKEAYDRVVLAGMHLLFDKKSAINTDDGLARNNGKPLGQKLSDGIVGLMMMLYRESKGTMPPQVIVPAATNLLLQMVEYVQKSGEALPPAELSKAMQDVLYGILQKMGGVSPMKLNQMFNQFSAQGKPQSGGA